MRLNLGEEGFSASEDEEGIFLLLLFLGGECEVLYGEEGTMICDEENSISSRILMKL